MSKKTNKKHVDINDEHETFRAKARIVPQYPVDFPNVISMDVIARYSDEELFSCISRLETDRSKILESRFDPSPWEIELAYHKREFNLRKIRKEKHDEFMRLNAHLLPEDNSGFDMEDFNSI